MENIYLSMALSRIDQCDDLRDIRDALHANNPDIHTERLINAMDARLNGTAITEREVYMLAFYILHLDASNG